MEESLWVVITLTWQPWGLTGFPQQSVDNWLKSVDNSLALWITCSSFLLIGWMYLLPLLKTCLFLYLNMDIGYGENAPQ